MARIEIVMPKMGESIMEGTIIEWSKSIGDAIEQDETLLEIATDKVDSEVPAPESGILVEILAEAGETIEVGEPIAILETDADAAADAGSNKSEEKAEEPEEEEETQEEEKEEAPEPVAEEKSSSKSSESSSSTPKGDTPPQRKGTDGRFFSPLVRSIATEEGISQEELESIDGSGNEGRVTKNDVMSYLNNRESAPSKSETASAPKPAELRKPGSQSESKNDSSINAGQIKVNWPTENVEVIKMDRMRKMIADHMVRSKQTSAHVTTFAEADVSKLVQYREKHKHQFQKENGFKLTFTPFFIEATIQAIREFPLINSAVNGDEIHLKRDINYGIAVALGNSGEGGLIVPVIKNAGEMNIHGIARQTNELAGKAREKKLAPDDLVGGTFTLTNYGSVGNLMGTPIINQPQVAIFGTGVIQKRPVVMEVDGTDTIAIRHMVYLSMSYDHRIIDGALGGNFMQRVKQLLEDFDMNRSI